MAEAFLLGRIALHFGDTADMRNDLSAVTRDADGCLWAASDEAAAIVRLRPLPEGGYGDAAVGDLAGPLDLGPPPAKKSKKGRAPKVDEIDIEGMDVDGRALWFAGSHTSTRGKTKGENDRKDLERLARVTPRPNRHVLGRATLGPGGTLERPMRLPFGDAGNALTEALLEDPHLGPFLALTGPEGHRMQLASKENGFDVEGLAARDGHLFLGLRGPVLRGWAAMLLEVVPHETADGMLGLDPFGLRGRRYRKHLVDLGGMGVRDLCWQREDLLILAGPTMDLTGLQTVWRLRGAAALDDDSVTPEGDAALERIFDLPVVRDADKAEGLCLYDDFGEAGVLVVYDAPHADRMVAEGAVLADVFRLPERQKKRADGRKGKR